ncbi:MAG TPA: YebC/PmpR family DNA-binding transcriptional regulator [candidate division Zixibacteria bacterium]|nr:YebC/PmpR family DNA-binding transcriptional regulator [candidate division Zixibacteria bacterium]
MSGHSKWASIKHKKAAEDAKRGKIFTKIIKEITVAARMGGGDPDGNPRLRTAVDAAKSANMPKSNIENAIKKGTGELPGVVYEEITYEGYGPAGVALLIETMTDNKNRTVAEIRHLLDKHGGNLGETGCVNWMFDHKGLIRVPKEGISEEDIFEKAIEAGAEDVQDGDDFWEIYTSVSDMNDVKEAVVKMELSVENSERVAVPQNYVKIEGKDAVKLMKIMDKLDDHDDVQNVFSNFDIDPEELERIQDEL